MINVSVHLKDQSQPIDYEDVQNVYEKGSLLCVLSTDGRVHKYPLINVWRVTEDYGPRQTTRKVGL